MAIESTMFEQGGPVILQQQGILEKFKNMPKDMLAFFEQGFQAKLERAQQELKSDLREDREMG